MSVDRLEIVRGALSSLAYCSVTKARPVHVHRLRWFVDRIASETDTASLLDELELVRDAQRLPGGYWMPSPSRCVPIELDQIVVSTATTVELRRQWGDAITIAGISRVASGTQVRIATESLEAWMGAPPDTRQWAAQVFNAARGSLQRADFKADDIEVFLPLGRLRGPGWERCPSALQRIEDDALVLCRSAPGVPVTPMFIARCSRQGLTHQASVRPSDRRRLRWGASLLMGHRVKVPLLQEDGEGARFDVFRELPTEETRLLSALGTIERPADGGARFRVQRKFLPVIRRTLARLGIDL